LRRGQARGPAPTARYGHGDGNDCRGNPPWLPCPRCPDPRFFHRICVFPASAVAPPRPFPWIGKSGVKRKPGRRNQGRHGGLPLHGNGGNPTAWPMGTQWMVDGRGNPLWLPWSLRLHSPRKLLVSIRVIRFHPLSKKKEPNRMIRLKGGW